MSERDVVELVNDLREWQAACCYDTGSSLIGLPSVLIAAEDAIDQLRARLPHWRSPEERPGDIMDPVVGVTYDEDREWPYETVFGWAMWVLRQKGLIAWRPLAEVVDEIPEELKR